MYPFVLIQLSLSLSPDVIASVYSSRSVGSALASILRGWSSLSNRARSKCIFKTLIFLLLLILQFKCESPSLSLVTGTDKK